jgi:hypothetical protein
MLKLVVGKQEGRGNLCVLAFLDLLWWMAFLEMMLLVLVLALKLNEMLH